MSIIVTTKFNINVLAGIIEPNYDIDRGKNTRQAKLK